MSARYFTDPKRKRWANNARRTVVGIAIVFILLMNFVSDFGSFATFAGFLTAGWRSRCKAMLMSFAWISFMVATAYAPRSRQCRRRHWRHHAIGLPSICAN